MVGRWRLKSAGVDVRPTRQRARSDGDAQEAKISSWARAAVAGPLVWAIISGFPDNLLDQHDLLSLNARGIRWQAKADRRDQTVPYASHARDTCALARG